MIMEDNAPDRIHRYHDLPREKLRLKKLMWPSNPSDLNLTETIWNEIKNRIKIEIEFKFIATMIRKLAVREWRNCTTECINNHIMNVMTY